MYPWFVWSSLTSILLLPSLYERLGSCTHAPSHPRTQPWETCGWKPHITILCYLINTFTHSATIHSQISIPSFRQYTFMNTAPLLRPPLLCPSEEYFGSKSDSTRPMIIRFVESGAFLQNFGCSRIQASKMRPDLTNGPCVRRNARMGLWYLRRELYWMREVVI